ncbi:MAG: recombination protein NinG [Nanoarchaeota archaeon]
MKKKKTINSAKLMKKLKNKAWKLMSLWVRKRDKFCFTCNGPVQQAGHWKHGVCDYEDWNIHGQCIKCNYFNSGAGTTYTLRMIDLYGLEKVKEYERIAAQKKGYKYRIEELNNIILDLTKKLNSE